MLPLRGASPKVSSLRYMHCWDRVSKGSGHEPRLEGWEGLFVTFLERAGFTYATDQTPGGTLSSCHRNTGSGQQHGQPGSLAP